MPLTQMKMFSCLRSGENRWTWHGSRFRSDRQCGRRGDDDKIAAYSRKNRYRRGFHNKPAPVDLFRFFWRELSLQGARVYEAQDFDAAIELAASGKLTLDRIASQIG
jgi:hypothetical protein